MSKKIYSADYDLCKSLKVIKAKSNSQFSQKASLKLIEIECKRMINV